MPIAHRFYAPVVLPMDPTCSVIRDGAVDVTAGGRISYCGPRADAPPHKGASLIRLTGILMPGLVNAHAHSAMTPLRGAGGDLPLMSWLNDVIWPAEARMRPADAYAGMLLGCIEMLQHGVTTSAEMYMHADSVAQAALAAGNRILLAPAYFDGPGAPWRSAMREIDDWIDTDGLRFGPGDRIELGYGPHSAYTLPAEALHATAESAAARGALVHTHVAESVEEDREQRARYGSVPRLLQETGLMDGRLLAAHAVHLSAQDIRLLADHGAGVAHCPGSNAKLASGIAPLTALRKAPVAVGLGTDGPASNDDLDLWDEMRLAMMLARVSTEDPLALTAADALMLATRGGAAALSRTDIGALSRGMWADMVHVAVDGPHFASGIDVSDEQLIANLVWAAGSRAIRDVWVAGEQVIAHGESTQADRIEAQRAVAVSASHLLATA
ncbi:amidohydrolase [Streptomyces labedae]|uniref:Ethylammeline chlorohydrolase n=3 Tax=Streptomyces TaxID=1883 RepID=A0ABQ2TZS0_9ACTN|nr:ethylammeline chlorohydrolase [Streptomyces griseoincarnatus]GGT58727.1 ethylammeline chlorohydrolase [Streptomyces variabilis]